MAIITQKRILNLIPKTSAPVTIHVSQGNVGETIEFTLVKGDELFTATSNLTATVHGVRSDGANFGPYTCTLNESKVSFTLKSAMAAISGAAVAEIVLVNASNRRVGSSNFAILVEDSAFPVGVTYSNDTSVYESILTYVQGAVASMNTDLTDLDTRIDEIIAPSGGAPSAAEVTDARIGEDGIVYATLGKAIRTQVGDLKSTLDNSNDGKTLIKTTFINGSVKATDGTIDVSILYRVCSQDILSYDYEQEFSVKSGFRYMLLFYNNSGNFLNDGSGWQTGTYTLPKNQKFRITIARITEDGSETADIDLFASKVSVNTKIAGEIAENADAIINLESQITDIASGETSIDFTFVNGSIDSTTGVIDTSVTYRIATPNIVSFKYNQNIKVNPGYRFMLLYFDASGDFEHDGSGWVTTNIDVPKGKKIKITIAKIIETTDTADVATFKSNVLIYTEAKTKLAQINPIIEYNIKANGTGDFANLRACFESITDSSETQEYKVNLYPGEYDIASLYTADEISSGYGLFIPDYVTLRGIGDKHNIIIKAALETQNNKWSPINIQHVASIENLSIISTNCRYSVHDDWQKRGVYKNIRRIKDCIFTGIRTYYGAVYGSGVKGNADWIFENCIFNGEQADQGGISGACVLLHNNVNVKRGNYVKFINCRFNTTKTSNKYRRGIILGSMTNNAANGTVTVTLEGCKVNGISMYENNASEYGAGINMYINGFYNDDADVMFTVTDGHDYSDHVDLF